MSGFSWLLRAEWTKFRTVRGWVLAIAGAAVAMLGLGLFPGLQGSCGMSGPGSECRPPLGPDGHVVTDSFTFVHQPLAGDGSVTVRVASLTGLLPTLSRGEGTVPGVAPWAKAGLIVKAGTTPGASYAAVMVTGAHGVRWQWDFTHDRSGGTGAAPQWLRLTRNGQTVTGEQSTDGVHWGTTGSARLPGLPATAQVGLFVTSPQYVQAEGPSGAASAPSQATAGFDRLALGGGWSGSAWAGDRLGPDPMSGEPVVRSGDGFQVTGTGDIAPDVGGAAGLGTTVTQTLVGTFAALIVVAVVGAMVVTGEYRRGLLRTTLAAAPRRGRVLAAKAVVVGAVAFVLGLVAAAVVLAFGPGVLRANGAYVMPASVGTELRLVAGTAALLAVAAVLALALGVLLRRGTAAVTTAVVVIVLPYLLGVSVLPAGAAQWLLRVSPAAAFAVQQSLPQYPQVDNVYTPAAGYFPLAPWAGFAVLCGWAAVALALAGYALRRRDV